MATVDSRPRRQSRSDSDTSAFPGLKVMDWFAFDPPNMSKQAARANLIGLGIMESWLTASRQMIDLWRTGLREQQDAMLAALRQQIVNTRAHDPREVEEEAEAFRRRTARRRPTGGAVASRPEETAATRH